MHSISSLTTLQDPENTAGHRAPRPGGPRCSLPLTMAPSTPNTLNAFNRLSIRASHKERGRRPGKVRVVVLA